MMTKRIVLVICSSYYYLACDHITMRGACKCTHIAKCVYYVTNISNLAGLLKYV